MNVVTLKLWQNYLSRNCSNRLIFSSIESIIICAYYRLVSWDLSCYIIFITYIYDFIFWISVCKVDECKFISSVYSLNKLSFNLSLNSSRSPPSLVVFTTSTISFQDWGFIWGCWLKPPPCLGFIFYSKLFCRYPCCCCKFCEKFCCCCCMLL